MPFGPLDKPVQFLKGVGPARSEKLGRMGIVTVRDLLYHIPRRYEDASTVSPIGTVDVGMDVTVVGTVRSAGILPTRKGLRIFQAVLQDDSGMITCSWPGQPWLERKVRAGDRILVTGPVRFFHGRQIQPREFTLLSREGDPETSSEDGAIFVAYPASEDVPQWVLRRIFERNLDAILPTVEAEEYLTEPELGELGLPPLREAFEALHRPPSLSAAELGRRRLAYDEFFFLQLVQAQARFRQTEASPGISFVRTNTYIRPLHEALPFTLTEAQARVIREIYEDMVSARRMNRLVQGDVGAGKTVVALFAIALCLEHGHQAALMAPTELLAEQHARKIGPMMEAIGLDVYLLTGRTPPSERTVQLERFAAGEPLLAVGTHALIQEGVTFGRLGLVVVDEQHRFGVRQRMALGEQGNPDVMVMSATPIPRSMALALYGDLDLSLLDEMPPGREPARTLLRRGKDRDEVYRGLAEQVAEGRQAYIVYPLVEESEKVDLRAATEEFERLGSEVFPDLRLGLIHGKLPSSEKDRIMRAFADGEIDVLVATTVIEVGIDVPNATVMVIEHAERFGLSQLHQLRGRVGRGGGESYCVLVAEPGEASDERLKIFAVTSDGFEIAREDLRIRGQGDLFGAQQHGRDPLLRYADLVTDEGLLVEAQRRARDRIAEDPELRSSGSERIRKLLDERHGERLKLFRVG